MSRGETNNWTARLLALVEQCVAAGKTPVALYGSPQGVSLILEALEKHKMAPGQILAAPDRPFDPTGMPANIRICSAELLPASGARCVAICEDAAKEEALLSLSGFWSKPPWPELVFTGAGHIRLRDSDYAGLSRGGGGACIREHLFQSVKYVLTNRIPGDFIELGVGAGYTSHFIGRIMAQFGAGNRKAFGIDTFQGFPERSHLLDICELNIEQHYKTDCGLESVRKKCEMFPFMQFIKAEVSRALTQFEDCRFAFSFHDMDNYMATAAALPFIYERTSPGGILAFDHYNVQGDGITIGQRIAVNEFLKDKISPRDLLLHGTNILIKGNA